MEERGKCRGRGRRGVTLSTPTKKSPSSSAPAILRRGAPPSAASASPPPPPPTVSRAAAARRAFSLGGGGGALPPAPTPALPAAAAAAFSAAPGLAPACPSSSSLSSFRQSSLSGWPCKGVQGGVRVCEGTQRGGGGGVRGRTRMLGGVRERTASRMRSLPSAATKQSATAAAQRTCSSPSSPLFSRYTARSAFTWQVAPS